MNATASVEVDVTPSDNPAPPQILPITGSATANNSSQVASFAQGPVNVVDFEVTASTPTPPVIKAGEQTTIQVKFCPLLSESYPAGVTPSQTISPSMVTSPRPTFNPTTVPVLGSSCNATTLTIVTVPRPVTTGSLFRRGSFYAAWLPIGGLSLIGLGIGAGRKRRRWFIGAVLGLIAGIILLQPGCGSSKSSVATSGGTQPGNYTITITGSAGTGASHNTQVTLQVT